MAEDRWTHARFSTTAWTDVLAARGTSTEKSAKAVEELCSKYWKPVYAFLRRKGRRPEEAADLVQDYFAEALRKDYFAGAERERGKFRTYVLATLPLVDLMAVHGFPQGLRVRNMCCDCFFLFFFSIFECNP